MKKLNDEKNNSKKIKLYFPPINKLGNIAFRKTLLEYGADIVSTEMIRVEKLLENDLPTFRKLQIPKEDIDKTIIQIICLDIENIEKGVDLIINYLKKKKIIQNSNEIYEINYNMGCPQSSLCKNECGGGIVANPFLVEKTAKKLYQIEQKYNIKTSIKIRLGINRENITIYENVKRIKSSKISKIYIHGRVLNDGYSKNATYDEIKKVIEDNKDVEIIANGDINSFEKYKSVLDYTKAKGVLIGRAALEDPKIFFYIKNNINKKNLSGDKLNDRVEQIKKFLEYSKKYDVTISQIKANLSYMTKGVIEGSKFREQINNFSKKEDLIKYILINY